ncbi:transducin family protein / WD-40 repeat family protein [Euphorbia peplus]|nr:transducin family protein / WD-40 repeat family protein [Euphorbia peplus]
MEKGKLKSPIMSFTLSGPYFAILLPEGTVKIWNTSDASLLAEWKQSDSSLLSYSCMACTYVEKKKKKEGSSVIVALGTSDGDIQLFAIDVSGKIKWESSRRHTCGVIGLAFANEGHRLRVIGTNGKLCEMKTKSGELLQKFKAFKKSVSAIAFSNDEKMLAVTSSKAQVFSLDDGQELLRLPDDLGPVQHIALSNCADTMVTSGVGEKQLHVWRCNGGSKTASHGPVLSMERPPLALKCYNKLIENEDGAILAVSDSGVVYVWNLKTILEDNVSPAKVTVERNEKGNQTMDKHSKKCGISIFAAGLYYTEEEQLIAVIAFGSIYSPNFRKVNVNQFGENIPVYASDETELVTENRNTLRKDALGLALETTVASTPNKKTKKKRSAADMDTSDKADIDTSDKADIDTDNGEAMDGVLVENDSDEPTMGEKLASLNLVDSDKSKSHEKQESPPQAKPPSADSVNILLKQALHAEDRALLLDCLYTQDDKVISNSVSLLSPTHVGKLLHSLLTIMDSRGAILACALPWLRSLLLQHSSKIVSQESSLAALNSLYQLIESRNSTFQPALQLSNRLDSLYSEVVEDTSDDEKIIPVIYEDNDESDEDDEEESEDAMETDEDGQEENGSYSGRSDLEGGEDMSD